MSGFNTSSTTSCPNSSSKPCKGTTWRLGSLKADSISCRQLAIRRLASLPLGRRLLDRGDERLPCGPNVRPRSVRFEPGVDLRLPEPPRRAEFERRKPAGLRPVVYCALLHVEVAGHLGQGHQRRCRIIGFPISPLSAASCHTCQHMSNQRQVTTVSTSAEWNGPRNSNSDESTWHDI